MITFEKLAKHPKIFTGLTGVKIDDFLEMASKIEPLWNKRRDNFHKGGRSHVIAGVKNHLLVMLIYYRCYITYEFLGLLFDVDETTAMRTLKRIEEIAVKAIHIEKKRELTKEEVEYLIIDATEQPVQRPKKGQKKYYSGKKKQHTQKVQITVDEKGKIHSVSRTHEGKKNDMKIHNEQKDRDKFLGVAKKADSGYQGINKNDQNAEIPHKKPKGGKLNKQQKKANRLLSQKRIKVENTIREIKIFKIMSNTYRNRRKNHNIKVNIISGIVNMKIEKRLKNAA